MYVMNTKLTLRLDDTLVERAKAEARARGKSVSQMVGEFIDSLGESKASGIDLPPVTASLLGVLEDTGVSEATYKKHLEEKYG